ncbi:MAG: S41 family peptidase [Candidatus Omnitrophota bacterium]|nr:S41 family peptidase [Candidatus Omnitrophota bacterium]
MRDNRGVTAEFSGKSKAYRVVHPERIGIMKTKIFTVLIITLAIFTVSLFALDEDASIVDDSRDLFKQVQLFADSITLISADYVKPVNVKDLVYGAIKGMMDTLDGYSQFLDPESFRELTEETKGEFGGIGIEIGIRDGILTVISPIEGTPAFEAGIQTDDKIVKIDDEVTQDMSLDDAVKRLRGEPGTGVKITVIREDVDKMLDFKLKRTVIKLKSIKEARIIEDDIAYVKLIEFQERTAKDLKSNLNRLMSDGGKSLILDLRNNPGGLLVASAEVADLFLKPGALIVYTEGRDPKKRIDFKSKKESDFDGMKLIALVNKGSASASEILAGAIQDNKRGLVIGVPTFGKASVQTVIPLKDNSALRLTTAAYYTPSGRNLMDKGIDPDIFVEKIKVRKKKAAKEKEEEKDRKKTRIFEKVKKKEKIPSREETKEEEKLKYDNQVQAAVNVLKGMQIFEEYGASRTEEEESPKEEQGSL